MLDVLELDVLGQPDEHGQRVLRVHVVGHLDARLLGLGLVLGGRVDQDGEVVEQRPLGVAGVAGVELDVRAADLDAGLPSALGAAGRKP